MCLCIDKKKERMKERKIERERMKIKKERKKMTKTKNHFISHFFLPTIHFCTFAFSYFFFGADQEFEITRGAFFFYEDE